MVANAVGIGVATWIAGGGVVVTGVSTGTGGVGTVAGKYLVAPAPLPVAASVAAAGVVGVTAPLVAAAIGLGVANALNIEAGYVGVSSGVGLGQDTVVAVVGEPSSLIAALSTAFATTGILGPTAQLLALGLGPGIAALVSTGRGTGAVTSPSPAPFPATAPSLSKLV